MNNLHHKKRKGKKKTYAIYIGISFSWDMGFMHVMWGRSEIGVIDKKKKKKQ